MDYPETLNEHSALQILLGVLDSIHDAIVTINTSHTVVFYNKKAEEVFGFKKEEVIGKDLSRIMSHNCAKDHKAAVKRYIETGIPKLIGQHSEIVATRKGNIPFPAEISFYVSKLGEEIYFTAIVKDLTETKDIEERLTACENLAGLGRMLAEVTHELKNPLMSIGGFARQLKKYITDEIGERKLEIILKEVERVEGLIRDLREYHLVKPPLKTQLDLNKLLREVIELFSPIHKDSKITFKTQLAEEPLLVYGNKERLKQVFLNLIQNAFDAVDEGGVIEVTSKAQEGKAVVEIRDSGCGLTEEELKRIFEPFYTTKPKGTGLGLCIAKRIVEEHQGDEIRVESEKGKGTTFRIGLPLITKSDPNLDANQY